jgi:hypothetical protein
MFRRHRLGCIAAAAALLFALPACGGDDDGTGPGAGDEGTGPDAGDEGTGGDAGAGCPFEDALGAVSLSSSKAEHRTQPPPEGQEPDPSLRALALAGAMDGATGSPTDFLTIELWDGYGPFVDSQLAAGEFSIEGDDTSPQDCGVCVNLIANFGDGDEANDRRYFASAGNVVVNSAGTRAGNEITGNFTGTMSDVTLTELDENGAPLEGGCSTTIEQATWDTPIENGD